MKLETLNSLTVEELDAVIGRAKELRDNLWRQRQDKAKQDALAALAAVGLAPKDLMRTKPVKRAGNNEWKPKAGHLYQHPDDAAKTWTGVGVRPGWVNELVSAGKQPKDVGPIAQSKLGATVASRVG